MNEFICAISSRVPSHESFVVAWCFRPSDTASATCLASVCWLKKQLISIRRLKRIQGSNVRLLYHSYGRLKILLTTNTVTSLSYITSRCRGPSGVRKNCNPFATKPMLLPTVFLVSKNWLYKMAGWSDEMYSLPVLFSKSFHLRSRTKTWLSAATFQHHCRRL